MHILPEILCGISVLEKITASTMVEGYSMTHEHHVLSIAPRLGSYGGIIFNKRWHSTLSIICNRQTKVKF